MKNTDADAVQRARRLQQEYLDAERALQRFGIEHTVVVFGSTRLIEPSLAAARVAEAQRQLAAAPESAPLRTALAIAERLQAKSCYYDMAREFGRLVSLCNPDPHRCRTVIMTGGGPGIMEAANRGAADVGAHSVGLNIQLPREQHPNPYVTPELQLSFHYFAIRKFHFLQRARALVVFPGGYGTLDELCETLTLVQTRKMPLAPVVLVGARYWRRVLDIDFLVDEGVIDVADRDLFWYAESAGEAWDGIVQWYRRRGEDPFGTGS